jgi:prepilin-type N-terminal cleavage/methylation domain-containing protein
MKHAARAFSLLELATALAITAILATLAAPSFGELRDEWDLRVATQAVLGGLSRARLGALSHQGEGRLCPSLNGLTCSARATGFVVTASAAADPPMLLQAGSLARRVDLSGDRAAATYYAWPRAALPVTLTLCALRERAKSRRVIVSQTGRPRVERAAAC